MFLLHWLIPARHVWPGNPVIFNGLKASTGEGLRSSSIAIMVDKNLLSGEKSIGKLQWYVNETLAT